MEWQPIETCPMEHGRRYLVVKDCGDGTLPSISVAFRIDGESDWLFGDVSSRTLEGYGYRVTHWMPLPTPPSEA